MGTKKLKKLTLKKETITNLSESEQNAIRGGGTWDWGCLGSAILMGACSAVGGCMPKTPDDQDHPGGYAETCGSAYTCNG